MKIYSVWLWLVFWLSGCTVLPDTLPQAAHEKTYRFSPAKDMQFNGKSFYQAKILDLGEMVRYIYHPTDDRIRGEKIVLFFDNNTRNMSLQQRLTLRQHSYQQSNNTLAELKIDDHILYSKLIYRPSQQFDDWGIALTKGKHIADCGFIEFQYSYGLKAKKQPTDKEQAFLAHYIYPTAQRRFEQLQQQPWQWQCQ